MQWKDRWSPNQDEVVAQIIDGEAILIRLTDGIYYSMGGIGAEVWTLLEKSPTLGEVRDTLAALYDVDSFKLENDLSKLFDDLVRERLVVPGPADAESSLNIAALGTTGKKAYLTPDLNVYRDMSDLLALDPPAPGLKDIPWNQPTP